MHNSRPEAQRSAFSGPAYAARPGQSSVANCPSSRDERSVINLSLEPWAICASFQPLAFSSQLSLFRFLTPGPMPYALYLAPCTLSLQCATIPVFHYSARRAPCPMLYALCLIGCLQPQAQRSSNLKRGGAPLPCPATASPLTPEPVSCQIVLSLEDFLHAWGAVGLVAAGGLQSCRDANHSCSKGSPCPLSVKESNTVLPGRASP